MENNKKSKYLRDGSEPKSKYIKTKENKDKKSDKKKKKEPASEKNHEYRDSVLTPKRAREMMLEEEHAQSALEELNVNEEAAFSEVENALPETELQKSAPEAETLENTEDSDSATVKSYHLKSGEDRSLKRRKNAVIRRVICIAVLLVLSFVLYIFKFRIPFYPKIFSIEFSVIPELIASIAYGPLVGVLICIVKNLFHMALDSRFIISDITNIMLNSVFLVIAGVMYSRSMFAGDKKVKNTKNKPGYRRRRIFASTVLGNIISLVPQFLITRYFAYPMLAKYYSNAFSMEGILKQYQTSMESLRAFVPAIIGRFLPEINSVSEGIIVFNMTATFAKLFIASVFVAIIYKYISPVLHYRKVNKGK